MNSSIAAEIRSSWITQGALAIAIIYVFVAIFGPLLAPHSPTALLSMPRQGPSTEFLLGTDEIGRDLLSRLLYGARVAFMVAIVATSIGLVAGAVLGLVAA